MPNKKLCIFIKTDWKNLEVWVKDRCGKIIYYGVAKQENLLFSIPKISWFSLSANAINENFKITNYYKNLPCDLDFLAVNFSFNKYGVKKFVLVCENYFLPVPNAILTLINKGT